uniref:Zgc:194221 n=1 Tax=Oncorhynchus kisutch TaxID=8019 RepID=A0A8C7MHU4_ONCKI
LETSVVLCCLVALVLLRCRQGRRRRLNPINVLRREHGQYYHLVQELLLDPARHHRYFRISAEEMETLLSFVAIQVGNFGRNSDGGVYANSPLGRAMASKTLQLPQDAFLPGGEDLGKIPYTMVGDAAFPLKPYLMRPYAGHNISYDKEIFNYRLCRARMTVEKAFGILAARWRILYQKINVLPSEVDTLVVAMCILHNFLTKPCDPSRPTEQVRRQFLSGKSFTEYFTSGEGRIDFQDRMVVGRPT